MVPTSKDGEGAASGSAREPEHESEADAVVDVPILREPADGVPPVVDTAEGLSQACRAFAAGSGPVALDAERSSGYRYGQRAFLIQARREGAGTALLDPEELGDLSAFGDAIAGEEWVLHSATQDLTCLAEAGLVPDRLFDTELAARLLGLPRVGLAGLTETLLGLRLSKGHSAADWSRRPLPRNWLVYAALDVELLVQLRDLLEEKLVAAGRWEWAVEEFEALVSWRAPQREQPWRRTSGVHSLRDPRQLAAARELWTTRDDVARKRDRAPGRIMKDAAIVAAAKALPTSAAQLSALPLFEGRRPGPWLDALARAAALPDDELPRRASHPSGPPPPRSWAQRDPEAADRLQRCREVVKRRSEELGMPPEVLISPDPVRRLAWQPPAQVSDASVNAFLAELGVRPWQRQQVGAGLVVALTAAAEEPPA